MKPASTHESRSSGVAGVQELQNGSTYFGFVDGSKFLPLALDPSPESLIDCSMALPSATPELPQLLNS
jgi:hypothetical protein